MRGKKEEKNLEDPDFFRIPVSCLGSQIAHHKKMDSDLPCVPTDIFLHPRKKDIFLLGIPNCAD